MRLPWKRKKATPGEIVLGAQTASAAKVEANHRALNPDTVSPLGGVSYDDVQTIQLWRDLPETSTDRAVRKLAVSFGAATPTERLEITESLTSDDFYVLFQYAKLSAARMLRFGDIKLATDALVALAMIDRSRIDWRDISWSAAHVRMALVSHH